MENNGDYNCIPIGKCSFNCSNFLRMRESVHFCKYVDIFWIFVQLKMCKILFNWKLYNFHVYKKTLLFISRIKQYVCIHFFIWHKKDIWRLLCAFRSIIYVCMCTFSCVVRKFHMCDPFEPELGVVSKRLGKKFVGTLFWPVLMVNPEAKFIIHIHIVWKKN